MPVSIESDVEITVVLRAEANGWLTRKLSWIGRRNAPDRFFSKPGRGVILGEFKHPKRAADRITQDREIQRLRDAGVTVYKINRVEEGDAIFT